MWIKKFAKEGSVTYLCYVMEIATILDYKGLYEQEKAEKEAVRIAFSILQASYDSLQLSHDTIKYELAQLKKMIFGSRHERFVADGQPSAQLTLDLAVEVIANVTVETVEVNSTKTITKVTPKPINHPGRSPLPQSLRREEIIIEPQNIPEGSKKIGEEITEELEMTPSELFVKRYVRPKYVLPENEESVNSEIIIAPMPVRPIEKAIAGPGLLAQVVIDKYVDHLPLYRQMQRFERAGVTIAYSTLTDWVSGTCKLIAPLYEVLKEEVLQSGYMQADETPIKVLDNNKQGKTHRGYLWVYNNSPGKKVFFDYQEGRGSEGPEGILKEYKGYLQTDGYQVYNSFDQKEGITLLHCMAHARRYFVEARDNDSVRADYVLEQMQQLYAIERNCKEQELDYEQRREVRSKVAMPILESLGKWMKEQYVQTLPKSPIGKALGYSIERWDRLCIYITNGMLNIDNNPVENSIRPVAIGRKNYLFCGSHEAAKRTAMLYSLLGTCKMNGINPFDWLKDVLERIPSHPINKIKELLPHKWSPLQN
jgi:transposase